jgi:lactate permease
MVMMAGRSWDVRPTAKAKAKRDESSSPKSSKAAMPWNQVYDPLGNWLFSTVLAALPIIVLLGSLAFLRFKAHSAAILGLTAALVMAIFVFGMLASKGLVVTVFGAAYGLFPIGWIILNVIFLYTLASEKGYFKILEESLTGITRDRRLQLLLIAFCFGAFFEGAAGFGTPVAVTASILFGLGFSPLAASGLSLIANTAPVAFGALGTPIIALSGVTGIEIQKLSAMVGRQLPFFSVIVPFWLVWAFAGFNGMIEIWPALLVAGTLFAVSQFLISNWHGPWLVDVIASVVSMLELIIFLLLWHPRRIWGPNGQEEGKEARATHGYGTSEVIKAWTPWAILSLVVFIWGIPEVKALLDGLSVLKIPVPGVHLLINRMPPVVLKSTAEAAVWRTVMASFFPSYRGGYAGDRLYDSLFGPGCGDGIDLRQDRRPVSFLWDAPWLVRRSSHRVGHIFQCALWQPAEDLCRTDRREPGAHGNSCLSRGICFSFHQARGEVSLRVFLSHFVWLKLTRYRGRLNLQWSFRPSRISCFHIDESIGNKGESFRRFRRQGAVQYPRSHVVCF